MNESHDWLIDLANETFAYLTTTGRHSGNPHRTEMWFGVHDGRIYVMSGGRDRSDWVKNLIADPRLAIEIDGTTRSGFATVLSEGSADDRIARSVLVNKYQKENELEEWGKQSLAIVIDVDC